MLKRDNLWVKVIESRYGREWRREVPLRNRFPRLYNLSLERKGRCGVWGWGVGEGGLGEGMLEVEFKLAKKLT